MKKKIVVEHCGKCFYNRIGLFKIYCFQEDKPFGKRSRVINKKWNDIWKEKYIPEWCPLEDDK